jgi:CHAT domain-containing protein
MTKIILIIFLFFPLVVFSQTIEETSDRFWQAVAEKNYTDQVNYGPKIVNYFKKNNYSVDSNYLDFLFRLGSAYESLNDHESSKNIFSESLVLCKSFYGNHNYNTTYHKYALVNSYWKLENNDSVLILAKECLREFDTFNGTENDYSILMLTYLSSTYEFLNTLDSASFYANEQVKRSILLYGKKSQSYLFSIFSLARINKNQNKYKEAKILFSECVELSKNIFDEKHYTYESSLYYLGEINMDLGLLNESIQNSELCIEIRKKVYGEDHFLYANAMNNLANCLQDIGDYNRSLSLNQRCYEIRKRLLGENHEQTWNSLSNIALNYSSLGDWKASLQINQELVKIKQQLLTENSFSYILSLSNLAVDYSNLSKSDSSCILSMKALKLLKTNDLKNTSLLSTITQNLAYYYSNKGLLDSAEMFINQSLKNIELLYGKNSLRFMQSLEILTTILKRRGQYDEALVNLKVIHDFKLVNYGDDSFLYAQSLSDLSSFYNEAGYFQLAVDSIQKALPIYKNSQGENHILTLQAMSSLAMYLNSLGRHREGLKINLEVLEKRGQTLGFQHHDYIISLINTALNYTSTANYENARDLNMRAISLQENKTSNLNPYLFTTALSNYGSLLLKLNIMDSSFYYSNRALSYTRKMIGTKSEEYVIKLNNLGDYYLHIGSFAFAKVYFDSAVAISEQIYGMNHPTTIQCLENLATTLGDLGEYSKAIDIEMSCLTRIAERRGKENLEYASGLNQLAYYDSKIGLDSLALKWNKLAYQIRKDILGSKHPSTLLSAYNLSVDYNNLGNYNESLNLLEECLKINIEIHGAKSNETKLVYNNIGLLYYDLKDYNKSLEFLTKAFDENVNNVNQDAILLNLSSVYEKKGDLIKAIEFQEKAVAYYLNDYVKNQLHLSDNEKSKYKNKLDYYVSYLIYLNDKNGFKDPVSRWYEYYISTNNLINIQNKIEKLPLSQGELIELKTISNQLKIMKAQKNMVIEMNENSSTLQNEIEKLEKQYSSLVGNFLQKSLTLEMIQNKLPTSESVFVDIITFNVLPENKNKYVSLVTSKNGIDFISLNSDIDLEEDLLDQYKENATNFEYKSDLKDSIFFNYFWKPILNKIGDAKTIFVSLGGVYNNINLNTIYNPETNKYLIEEKDIRIVNSARDFVFYNENEIKKYTSNTASLFGYPNFDGNTSFIADTSDLFALTRDLNSLSLDSLTRGGMKAKPLPATKTEVENISSTFKSKGWLVNSFLADNASETNIKKQHSPRVLHIATHGYFFQDISIEKDENRFLGMDRQQVFQDPMLRSGLLFTGANKTLKGETTNGENGLLSASEASVLDLSETELVILSACETGKGELTNSEGVYGLRKAFADAGAKNVIMSLWKVDDKATQEFMTRFYEIWLNEKTTIRDAFNKTQLEIMMKYPQPYYWGAFILVEN